ncbi:MAG: efflux RND transporter periplasmic adaptor subunit [Roseburia sp.]|nr:efflux RND transporter periplasmic adaptor subunit [Roseburia sp.]
MKDKAKQTEKGAYTAAPKKKKKKVLIIVLAIVIIFAAVIGTAIHSMTKQVEITSNGIEVEPVQLRDLSDTISLKGTVAGKSRMNVTSMATAEVTAVDVQVGDIVTEGDTLVTLDQADIETQIAELEKSIADGTVLSQYNQKDLQQALDNAKLAQTQSLADAQKMIDRAEAAYDEARNAKIAAMIEAQQNAETEEARAKLEQSTRDFVNEGYKSDADLKSLQQSIEDAKESYERTLLSTNQSVADAQTAIERSKYSGDDSMDKSRETLDDLKKQLNDCELKAPCSGVVVAVNVSVGDKNTPGQTLITMEDTSSLKMVASVEEADILKLNEGMNAIVTSDATGEASIKGEVTRVVRVKGQSSGSSYDMAASTDGYSVEISLDTTELLVGMSTKARVMITEKREVLAVPYDLIQYDEDGNAYVLVAEENGDGSATAVKRNVEVGEEIDYYTEITGGDLKEGDLLIYDYTYSIQEGQSFTPEQIYSEQSMGLGSSVGEAGKDGVISAEVAKS